MKTFYFLTLMTLLTNLAGASVETQILHINAPEKMGEKYELLLANDRSVLEVDANDQELINKIYDAQKNNSLVSLELKDEKLNSLQIIQDGEVLPENTDETLHPMSNYTPSVVDNYETAIEMFNSLNGRTKWFSQCFNRAHIWAKEMYNNYNVESMKILIYYTKKYRREINKKWWFHIAPMINVNGQRYVMDKEFTRKPTTDTDWEKIFTKKMEEKGIYGHRCKVIKNIKEFYAEENQKNEYCNIQVTSMYYWEPNDMSRLDKTGEEKTEFINRELRIASKEAFKKWKKVYEGIKVSE